jgi:RNA recognition motif-containing protein
MTKLFVVGFPRETSEIELDQLFTNHALVRDITIIRDMQTGESKGYAFVDMMDEPGAERAIKALDGMTFGKRVMSVRLAEQKKQHDQSNGARFNSTSRSNNQSGDSRRNQGQASHNRPRRPNNS